MDQHFAQDFMTPGQGNYDRIERMLINLALNHSVVIEKGEQPVGLAHLNKGETPASDNEGQNEHSSLINPSASRTATMDDNAQLEYSASSPDELALVNGARYLGATYMGRDALNNSIFNISVKGNS